MVFSHGSCERLARFLRLLVIPLFAISGGLFDDFSAVN